MRLGGAHESAAGLFPGLTEGQPTEGDSGAAYSAPSPS
jgi:hypothetical protein